MAVHPELPRVGPPTVDPVAARRWARMAPTTAPWLHEEVARRMQDRLQWIRRQPASWLHWEPLMSGLQGHALVQQRYPEALCHAYEPEPARRAALRRALDAPWWRRWRQAALRWDEPAQGSVDLVWSNMALHMQCDPQALIAQWARALDVQGFLMFSCLGPDTLRELAPVYRQLGWPPAGHDFTDMHDWGDMLVHAGFAEPVMDMERITLSYDTTARLLQDLRELGRNLHPRRYAALRSKGWRRALDQALDQQLPRDPHDGRLLLTFEVIYGHAFRPAPRLSVAAQSVIPVNEMRRQLRLPR